MPRAFKAENNWRVALKSSGGFFRSIIRSPKAASRAKPRAIFHSQGFSWKRNPANRLFKESLFSASGYAKHHTSRGFFLHPARKIKPAGCASNRPGRYEDEGGRNANK